MGTKEIDLNRKLAEWAGFTEADIKKHYYFEIGGERLPKWQELGREWHIKHGRETWKNRKPKTTLCKKCHQEFEYYTRAYYCSAKCKMAQYRREDRIKSRSRNSRCL
ncbi:hypothetical protein LCGC14_1620920 [marine sediment metagenome]|uniref:Uncharacterized protein n=1 Tax=marine sediment metagenome TaxID=412755 RepID=A0A0F9I5I8_9ZZZZ